MRPPVFPSCTLHLEPPPPMPPQDFRRWLAHYGYLDPLQRGAQAVLDAVARLRDMYGAPVGGATLEQLVGRPRCGVRDRAARHSGQLDDRPLAKRIRYWHAADFRLRGLSQSASRAIVDAAFATIQSLVPLPVERSTSAAGALILVLTHKCDGPGPELALADQLTLREPEQREIWLETSQDWSLGINGDAPALTTLMHEALHTLGLPHLPGRCLMAPASVANIAGPQMADVAALYQLYPEFGEGD